MGTNERKGVPDGVFHLPLSFCFFTFSAACRMMVSLPWLMACAAIAPSCADACDEVFFCTRARGYGGDELEDPKEGLSKGGSPH